MPWVVSQIINCAGEKAHSQALAANRNQQQIVHLLDVLYDYRVISTLRFCVNFVLIPLVRVKIPSPVFQNYNKDI